MVLIDQFMFANPQFVDRLLTIIDDDPEKKTQLVEDFGGRVVELAPGTYRIERDPFKGRPEYPENLYEPPREPGRGIMWAVLHDNRGGTDWKSLPVEIR